LLSLGLKKETADCVLIPSCNWDGTDVIRVGALHLEGKLSIPAWSLHRLIEIVCNRQNLKGEICSDIVFDEIIDCIEHEIKEGYFNKEYLV
jgi:hypothetical protein